MDASLRLLRILQMALLASVFLYGVIGELAGPKEPKDVRQIQVVLMMLGLGLGLGAALWLVRQRMIAPAEEVLRAQPEDAVALMRWRAGNIATFALAEAIAIYGLVLRMLGGKLQQSVPFYAAATLLLVVLGPRRPE